MAERTVRVQTMLTEEEADEIRNRAADLTKKEKRRVSMSDVVRDAVLAALKRWKKKR
jgi:Arc/MetJ-type ribon-helix-helix transcriptional regulator